MIDSQDMYDDPNSLPDDSGAVDQGNEGAGGDGMPGVAAEGAPGWRAGAFAHGGGLLGVVKLGGPPAADGGDPGLVLVSDRTGGDPSKSLPDYETGSWRWNDPEAIAYDLDRKQGQLAQVQGMANAAEGVSDASVLPAWASRGVGAFSSYMSHFEASHLQDQIKALQARQSQLRGQGGT